MEQKTQELSSQIDRLAEQAVESAAEAQRSMAAAEHKAAKDKEHMEVLPCTAPSLQRMEALVLVQLLRQACKIYTMHLGSKTPSGHSSLILKVGAPLSLILFQAAHQEAVQKLAAEVSAAEEQRLFKWQC